MSRLRKRQATIPGLHLAVAAAALAVLLGYIGYSRVSAPSLSVTDRFFSALQLFSLNEGVPAGGTPWQLDGS